MKPFLYLMASVFALFAMAGGMVSAQEPARVSGRVVVLDNGNVLEGEVERQGDMYIVRRPLGELKVPVTKAVTVCATLEDAYKFLASRANLRDGDDRLRSARRCEAHGLREQAIAEANASLQMRPGHAESKQLLAILEQPKTLASPPAAVEKATAPTEAAAILEVTADCLALFTNKVQPILMNTCAGCHANGKGGTFVLSRSSNAGGQRTTQLNLTAAIKQIHFAQPAASPLLHKACCAHGGAAHAALENQPAVPMATLQSWVELVVARNPHLKANGTTVAAVEPPPLSQLKMALRAVEANTPVAYAPGSPNPVAPGSPKTVANVPVSPNAIEKVLGGEKLTSPSPTKMSDAPNARPVEIERSPAPTVPIVARPVAIQQSPSQTPVTGTPATPRPLTEEANAQPANEFDPMIFNGMWHPGR